MAFVLRSDAFPAINPLLRGKIGPTVFHIKKYKLRRIDKARNSYIVFLIIQILLFDTDLNCIVLAAAYAVVPSRTNLLFVAVLYRNKSCSSILIFAPGL